MEEYFSDFEGKFHAEVAPQSGHGERISALRQVAQIDHSQEEGEEICRDEGNDLLQACTQIHKQEEQEQIQRCGDNIVSPTEKSIFQKNI